MSPGTMRPDTAQRDHGGGLDRAVALHGGTRQDWLDLSTGINPVPYPVAPLPERLWRELPDSGSAEALEAAARRFWRIPKEACVLAAPGASALIARIPALAPPGRVAIPEPTYNEHLAAFRAQGWEWLPELAPGATAQVAVHPNNPTGRLWQADEIGAPLCVIDESFCDTCPDASLVGLAARPGVIVLKSFGKFWGLAGLRLGFAIGERNHLRRLADLLGPWPVSGPAVAVATAALDDCTWAETTRARLARDSARLDALMNRHGARTLGGTTLFRLYEVADAQTVQQRLARHHVWSRIFPYSRSWIRLGLPGPEGWARLEAAL